MSHGFSSSLGNICKRQKKNFHVVQKNFWPTIIILINSNKQLYAISSLNECIFTAFLTDNTVVYDNTALIIPRRASKWGVIKCPPALNSKKTPSSPMASAAFSTLLLPSPKYTGKAKYLIGIILDDFFKFWFHNSELFNFTKFLLKQ